MNDVLLVNLNTGETMKADHYELMERGIPEGFRETEHISIDDWIAAIRAALEHKP